MKRRGGKKRPRPRTFLLKLLLLLVKLLFLYIRLSLLKRAWRSLRRTISEKVFRLKNLPRRFKKMPKVKVTSEMPEDGLPPMAGSEGGSTSVSPSIGSENLPSPEGVAVVDPALAAEIIDLPYQAWAIFEKRVPKDQIVLSNNMKEFLGGPVSRVMTKYGLGKIAKDEIVIIVTLSAHTFAVVSAIRKAQPVDQDIPKDAEG
jgi:hypothetical protein